MFTKRKSPTTGEIGYHYFGPPPGPAPESPQAHLGGRVDVDDHLWIFADRMEMNIVWCHSSGHAELYFDGDTEVIRRGAAGWPADVIATLARRFGDKVAAEAERILADIHAFG